MGLLMKHLMIQGGENCPNINYHSLIKWSNKAICFIELYSLGNSASTSLRSYPTLYSIFKLYNRI